MRKALFFSIFVLLVLVFPIKTARAQGTFRCIYDARFGCSAMDIKCDSGYKADVDKCKSLQKASCNQTLSCISTAFPEPEKADYGGLVGATGLNPELSNIGAVISKLLPYFFTIAGILLLLYLIFGGFQLMLSRGDPKAVQSAQSKITGAVVGFVIVFLAYWLVQILGRVLGIEQFTQIFTK